MVAHTTLLEISCRGSINPLPHRLAFLYFVNKADPDQAALVKAARADADQAALTRLDMC